MLGDLVNLSNFDFFARYFLAGFIVASARSRYVLGERPKASEFLFESVILSLLNQMVFLFLGFLLGYAALLLPAPLMAAIQQPATIRLPFFIEALFLPAALGMLLGISARRGWRIPMLGSLGMPVIHPTSRAYDFAFGDIKSERFVIVTFTDGTTAYGFFGANSLASSDPSNRDIYIERLYDVCDGTWMPTQPPKSALLMLRDVRSIEFIEPAKETGHDTEIAE